MPLRLMRLTKEGFRRLTFITISAVYLLILVGGIVRSVGAGMGCPDWPKCFGSYVPPLSSEDLPADYQDYFLEKRIQKNDRLASTFLQFGFRELADKISNDPNVLKEESFDVTTAWIEYINRLIGVVIGLLIVATFIGSFIYRKSNLLIVAIAFLSFILVVFQGWVGSLVVSTNLLPEFITVHMFLALLLVMLLIYLYHLVNSDLLAQSRIIVDNTVSMLGFLMFLLLIPQIYFGTNVRGQVDSMLFNELSKDLMVDRFDWVFYFHRSFSLLFLFLGFALMRRLWVIKQMKSEIGRVAQLIAGLIFVEIVGGALMAYFSIPAFIQPIHLLASTLLFGLLFYLVLLSQAKTLQKA